MKIKSQLRPWAARQLRLASVRLHHVPGIGAGHELVHAIPHPIVKAAPRSRAVTFQFQVPDSTIAAFTFFKRTKVRVAFAVIAVVILVTEIIPVAQPVLTAHAYALNGGAAALLPAASRSMADKLQYDDKQAVYNFNANYTPPPSGPVAGASASTSGGAHITALAHEEASRGVTVTDPVNSLGLTLKPKFNLLSGKKQDNRVVYPLTNGSGQVVYTMQADRVKEDIVLNRADSDKLSFSYALGLEKGNEAKLRPNGSVGIYGSDLLSANVSTGSDKDAALLQKARQNAAKTKLLFVIPAPVINEANQTVSKVKARYALSGSTLTLNVSNLKQGRYPLAIDPSVFVTSASQFMAGNNESNIDFDTTNDLIDKGSLTGARIPSWTSTTALSSAIWNQGTAVGGGYIYAVGGSSGSANVSTLYWAKFDPSTKAITNPNSSDSNCTSWCTNSAYNLPAARSGLSVMVYNGYLYAVGGQDASCTGATGTGGVCKTVYYAKLGANGEPISWNSTTVLSAERQFAGAVAYNNKLYLLGGQTSATSAGVTTSEYASINPDGTLGSWTSTTALPSARWGHSVLQYNGYMYLVGGNSSGTLQNSVQYIKINSDGTLASFWVTTNTFTTARQNIGGSFATIWGGYMYIIGGCSAINGTPSCTTVKGDMQLASINADGSITGWTTQTTSLGTALVGQGVVAWRNTLYVIGGCTTMNAGAQTCSSTQSATQYGKINSDGDVSPIFPSPSSNYFTTTSYLGDLPPAGAGAGQGGRIAMGVVINNGYIYVTGGCANVGCTTMSGNTSYAALSSTGALTVPGTCAGTTVNTVWCVDSTHTLPTAIGAMGATVYNNVLYLVGGFTGAANTRNGYHISLSADGSLNTGGWSTDTNVIPTAAGYVYVFARAVPNNGTQSYLYTIGGCTGGSGIGCSGYVATVQRCTITNTGSAPGSCTTTGQQQLLFNAGNRGGLGIFGGAVYGSYVYLAGGANSLATTDTTATGATCTADPTACGGQMGIVQYAKVDASGNITRADGTVLTGAGTATWNVASSRLTQERRRTTAFAINGYLYVVAGHNGTAPAHTLNDIQKGKINVSTGDITGFSAVATTITDRWDLRAATANGYIYMLGGCTAGAPPASCTTMNGVGEYVQMYNNWSASPASYTSSGNLPATDRYGGGATILNGYLYLAGGCTSTVSDCSNTTTGTASTDVTYAPLNADGSLGAWNTNATYALPAARAFGRLEAAGGTLYYIGGQTSAGVAQTTVYYSTPTSGTPAAWATATNGLPAARSQLSTSVYNGRIYASGGFSGTNATPTTTVYYSPDLSSGGNITSAWTSNGTSFQLARSGASTVAYGNNLYVLGGFDGSNYLLDVQYAPINSDGSVGTWGFAASLPQSVRQGDAFAANGFLYLFGGRASTATNGCTNNTYDVPINADGSIGIWSQTSVKYNTARSGVAAAYDSGRAYLLGGLGCAAAVTLTGADRTVYATLQAQPQLANYSIMIDTDTNVFPSKYLINGLDNGIGAAWYMTYLSSTSATASWGQSTNVGKLSLGTPGTYTPRDGAGIDTNTTVGARYYMLFLKIDDQQAFGFPEDVSRGPNIYDITLQFTSDPSKRLRNGKTFTGGLQQPLDTPF